MMTKGYMSKSAIFLAMLVAAGSAQLTKAEETTAVEPLTTTANTTTSTAVPAETAPLVADTTPATATADTAVPSPVNSTSSEMATASADNATVTAPVEGQSVDVRILSTTDLHSNLVNYDYYQDKEAQSLGLAKTAVLIDAAKKENSNVVLVDNGDILQGTPLATYKAIVDPVEADEVHPMYAALKALNFDASTLGNHEFNYGLDYLDRVMATAGLPIGNVNVLDAKTGKPKFKPFDIITKTFTDKDGKTVSLKIGITGVVPPQIMSWDKANLTGKVTVKDAVEAVKEVIPTIRAAGADLVLVLATLVSVMTSMKSVKKMLVTKLLALKVLMQWSQAIHMLISQPYQMAVFTITSKVLMVKRALINGVPVTMGGKYGDHLGLIDLNLTYTNGQWKVNKDQSRAETRQIDSKSNQVDPTIIALAKEAHDGTVAYVRQQVGTTTAPINSYFALIKDDPSIQIVNNAQRWYAEKELAGTPEANLPLLSAAAPFKAGYTKMMRQLILIFLLVQSLSKMSLTFTCTTTSLLFLKVTGADLKEWLEMSAGQFNTIDPSKSEPQDLVNTSYRTYNFDVIDGLTYEFDVTQKNKYDSKGNLVNPDASRVRNLKYMGKDIDPKQEFMVVTNNYRASGNFPGVKNATLNRLLNLENRQAIINYIVAEKTINPSADNNWYFADTIKGLNLRFLKR
uniref:Cyclo-nucleotide phosphodiesterase, putative n=1 Tax=Streptococcus dysgalactiae subsp. equisimilis TaxID=119602 RepID=Q9L4N0_STREQ|nr:cyclo-nucleotide phosphodiesterase, putative [Streptococcus dysgalactiae subsp. equisimilis]